MRHEEIIREIGKCFQMNENEDTTHQNVWDAAKAGLRGKCIAANTNHNVRRKISN